MSRHRPAQRHPGGRPRRRAARPGRARRRPAQLHRAGRRDRPRPSTDVAAAGGARAHRPASSATPPAATSPGPLFALHAAVHDPLAAARPDRPARARGGRRAHRRDRAPRRARGDDVVHIAQVDVDVPALRPRLEPGRRARRTARRSARCSTPTACSPLPPGRLERRTDRTVTTREALPAELEPIRRSGYADHRRRARDRADRDRRARRGRDGVCRAIGVSGPTARLQDRLDHLGRAPRRAGRRAVGPAPAQDPATGPHRQQPRKEGAA